MSEIGQQVINAVRSKAAENPEFVYINPLGSNPDIFGPEEFCVYVRDRCPSCLIGHALWNLDLIDASLEEHGYNGVAVDDLLAWLESAGKIDDLDSDEIKWLGNAQAAQDAQKPWGEAISFADNYNDEMLTNW